MAFVMACFIYWFAPVEKEELYTFLRSGLMKYLVAPWISDFLIIQIYGIAGTTAIYMYLVTFPLAFLGSLTLTVVDLGKRSSQLDRRSPIAFASVGLGASFFFVSLLYVFFFEAPGSSSARSVYIGALSPFFAIIFPTAAAAFFAIFFSSIFKFVVVLFKKVERPE